MGPRAREAGQRILHAGQCDLQHRLAGLGAVGENFQDDFLPVDDREAGLLLPVALLGGREFLVEHDDVGAIGLGQRDELSGLAAADEKLGLLPVAQVDERGTGDGDAEILDELDELGEQLRPFARLHVRRLHADEQGAGRGFLGGDEISHGRPTHAPARALVNLCPARLGHLPVRGETPHDGRYICGRIRATAGL